MDPNIASVSITYALTLSGLFQFCVRQSAEAENLVRKMFFFVFNAFFIK